MLRVLSALFLIVPWTALAQQPVLRITFERPSADLRISGARIVEQNRAKVAEFTTSRHHVELDVHGKLDGASAVTIGGWFYPQRSGEQVFFSRGEIEIAPQGERMFRPRERWVNFVLGTDQHGFLMATINGNGIMPFPLVSLNAVPINSWSQLVVVKDAQGHHKLYHNGARIYDTSHSSWAGRPRGFVDRDEGEPILLSMPMGGRIGEAWVYARELSAEEIAADFAGKKDRYHPAHPARPVLLRKMDEHPAAGLWERVISKENWPGERRRILDGMWNVFGRMPAEKVALDAQVISDADCGSYIRRKVSIQVQEDDRMPAYLLIPKPVLEQKRRAPAIICFYGTTSGAGKETTVGLSGGRPGSPPERNRAFAIDMVEAGFVAFAADYLRDGERIRPGRRPYDTAEFYERFPEWSIHGKDAWDTSRAIDYLQSLPFVDADKIGMTGHSYGGHSTVFCAALDERIKVAVANGPVSDFLHHGMHWGVPKGAGNSQSLPGMRPYVLDHAKKPPITFYEVTALIAPRPLMVGQAVGERRPMEEENAAAVGTVYRGLGMGERVRYVWYPGDHDYPPQMRAAAVEWFKRWFAK